MGGDEVEGFDGVERGRRGGRREEGFRGEVCWGERRWVVEVL